MDQDLQKKIEVRFEELPADVQRAIKSADVDKKVRDVATKNQLHVDQSGALGDEVLMAMMGFTDMGDFADNIAEHVKVPADKAEAIAQDIGTALFIPIRQSMQEFMEERALQETILADKREVKKELPKPITPPIIPPPSFAPKPAIAHPADLMLTQKTVTVAPVQPTTNNKQPTTNAQPTGNSAPQPTAAPKPQPYKADPYREPTS